MNIDMLEMEVIRQNKFAVKAGEAIGRKLLGDVNILLSKHKSDEDLSRAAGDVLYTLINFCDVYHLNLTKSLGMVVKK